MWCNESSKYLQLYPRQERKARIDWSTFKSVPNFPARSVNIPWSLKFSAIDAAGVNTEDFSSKHLRTWELCTKNSTNTRYREFESKRQIRKSTVIASTSVGDWFQVNRGGGGEETRFALRHHVHVALARRDIAASVLDAILEHLRLIAT